MPIILPHDASTTGHHLDAALRYLIWTTGLAFAAMATVLLVAVVFHRGAARHARYTHGNRLRDRAIAGVAAAVVLFGIDAVAVVRTSDHLRSTFWRYPDQDPGAFRVEVTAQQWAWNFRYPGPDARFGTDDDLVTLNELRVPSGRAVYLQLTSKDVVHSFYLPNFRTKIDAVPGTVTRLWFQPRELGRFEIACAQHCGAWHYKMRGQLTVENPEAFERWMARSSAQAAARRTTAATDPHASSPAGSGSAAGAVPPATTFHDPATEGWPWAGQP